MLLCPGDRPGTVPEGRTLGRQCFAGYALLTETTVGQKAEPQGGEE